MLRSYRSFHYMAMANNKQRIMPMPDDQLPPRGQPLAYPEAVHGWVSFDPPIVFWQITPSDEFQIGRPQKQNLTSHVSPTMLAVSSSIIIFNRQQLKLNTSGCFRTSDYRCFRTTETEHFKPQSLSLKFTNGEYWKKIHGPVFMYLNSCLHVP
jgi:rhamnogalacturonan endolyase